MSPIPQIRSFGQDLDGLHVWTWEIQEAGSGLLAFLSLVERSVKPSFGGIRRQRYNTPTLAFIESQSLAIQMAQKLAFAGLGHGGAKMTIVDSDDFCPSRAYPIIGTAIQELGGRYFCGPDVGTGEREMAWLRAQTKFANHVDNDAGLATAEGVVAGMRAAANHLGWTEGLRGRRILIQGLGAVGAQVAQELTGLNAHVLLMDIDENKSSDLQARLKLDGKTSEVVRVRDFSTVNADIFCPCAIGGVVGESCARFSIVCGSANLQTTSPGIEEFLFGEGCLYVPEIAVNAGAVIEGVLKATESKEPARRSREHIVATEHRVGHLLKRSQECKQSPSAWIQNWWQSIRP